MHCCEFLDFHLKLNDCIRINFKEKIVELYLIFFCVITAWVSTKVIVFAIAPPLGVFRKNFFKQDSTSLSRVLKVWDFAHAPLLTSLVFTKKSNFSKYPSMLGILKTIRLGKPGEQDLLKGLQFRIHPLVCQFGIFQKKIRLYKP